MVLKKSFDIPEATAEEKAQREEWRNADAEKSKIATELGNKRREEISKMTYDVPIAKHWHKSLADKVKKETDFVLLTSSDNERLGRLSRAEDIESAGNAATLEAITREAKKRGLKVDYVSAKSSHTGGSHYVITPNGDRVRISDHKLPETQQRLHNRSMGLTGNWSREVILNDWRTKSMDEYMQDILGAEHFDIDSAKPVE